MLQRKRKIHKRQPRSMANILIAQMGMDNNCTFLPSLWELLVLKAICSHPIIKGLTKDEIDLMVAGEESEKASFIAHTPPLQLLNSILEIIFNGESRGR